MSTLLVMNCNTSAEMTADIVAQATAVARPGTVIRGDQPDWGPASAEGYYDSFLTAAAVLDKLTRMAQDGASFDALIMAGFGEHGREGARELLDVPVVDITEAAAMHAMLLGRRFAVVTTVERAAGQIEESLATAGLWSHCVGVEATGLAVLDVASDWEATAESFVVASRRALARGADVLCLGCAGMAGLQEEVGRRLGVPVIDGVSAAVALAEGLVAQGLRTSKVGGFASPLPKQRPGWPVGR